MKIRINKDFETAFPDEFVAGFTLKQSLTALVGLAIAGVVALILYRYSGFSIVECTYIGIPVMIPVVAVGFFTYQMETPIGMAKEFYYESKTKLLLYEPEEYEEGLQRVFSMQRSMEAKGRKRRKGSRRKRRREKKWQ